MSSIIKKYRKFYFIFSFIIPFAMIFYSCAKEPGIVENGENQIKPSSKLSKTISDNNLVLLQVIQNWAVTRPSAVDYMLSSGIGEVPPGINEGQFAYGCGETEESTIELMRMYNSSFPDHLVSVNPSSENTKWILEQPNPRLSWLWASSPSWVGSGTFFDFKKIYRTTNNSTSDRGTTFDGDTPPSGYSFYPDYPNYLAYGFKRYGMQREVLDETQFGNITIKTNRVAGGIVWELNWSGKQFINHEETDLAGRGMQTDCLIQSTPGQFYNPTEGGDNVGSEQLYQNYPIEWRHGSPLLKYELQTGRIETEVNPLIWNPAPYNGGADVKSNPVMWKGKIKKLMELKSIGSYDNIIKWTATITPPSNPKVITDIEVACAHLTNEFNSFYLFNTSTQQFDTINVPQNTVWGPEYQTKAQSPAVIISTTNENYAMGAYYNGYPSFSWKEGWQIVNYTQSGSFDANAQQCSKWGLVLRPWPELYSQFTGVVYVVVGNLTYVKAALTYMYNNQTELP